MNKISEEIKQAAVSDYLSGAFSVKEIAKKHGITEQTICRWIPKEQRRGNDKIPADIKTSAISDYLAGKLTVEQICEKYRISGPTLYSWVPKEQHRGRVIKRKSKRKDNPTKTSKRDIAEELAIRTKRLNKINRATRKILVDDTIKGAIIGDYIDRLFTIKELTKKYGLSEYIIYSIIPENQRRGNRIEKKAKGKRFSEDEKLAIVADYIAGELSVKEICEKYEIKSRNTVYEYISRYGQEAKRKELSQTAKRSAITDYIMCELSVKEICEKYGISSASLSKWLSEDIRRKGKDGLLEQKRAVIECYITGELSIEEICEKFKIGHEIFWKWIPKKARKRGAIEDYKAGKLKVEEIAQKYGVSDKTITNWIPKEHRRGRSAGGRWGIPLDIKASAIADYLSSVLTVKEICGKYGISEPTLRNWIPKEQRRRAISPPQISEPQDNN